MKILPWETNDCTVNVTVTTCDDRILDFHYTNATVLSGLSSDGSTIQITITADSTPKLPKPKKWVVGDTVTNGNWLTLPNDTVIELVPHRADAALLDVYAIYYDGSLYDPEFGFRLTDIGGYEKWKVLHFLTPLVKLEHNGFRVNHAITKRSDLLALPDGTKLNFLYRTDEGGFSQKSKKRMKLGKVICKQDRTIVMYLTESPDKLPFRYVIHSFPEEP